MNSQHKEESSELARGLKTRKNLEANGEEGTEKHFTFTRKGKTKGARCAAILLGRRTSEQVRNYEGHSLRLHEGRKWIVWGQNPGRRRERHTRRPLHHPKLGVLPHQTFEAPKKSRCSKKDVL